LKAVVQETGIKPDTLRAWERRYGLPQPDRTSGGHRLYSQHDIDLLKWLLDRQGEGLSISRAVDLWQNLEEKGESPLTAYGEAQLESAPLTIEGESLSDLRDLWLNACLNFDEMGARQTLAQAFAMFPTEVVCFEILQKGLVEVGIGWYESKITVPQEHFASSQAVRQLETLLNAAPLPIKADRLLVACAPEEQHTFGVLLLTLLLRNRGWPVIYLGANVPVDRLETAVASSQARLLIVAAQTLVTAGKLLAVAQFALEKSMPLAFGGGVFSTIPDTVKHIPGYFLGSDLQRAPQQVERFLASPVAPPEITPVSAAYEAALAQFIANRTLIESEVMAALADAPLSSKYWRNANQDFGENIVAALTLGDMDLLTANIEWIEGLLANYPDRLPKESLRPYLETYQRAASVYLNGPVVAWLAQLL